MTRNLIHNPLFDNIKDYLSSSGKSNTLYLLVPYIRTEVLENLIEGITSKVIIITNWDTQNILKGSSELDLYPFCKKRGYTLYINNQIHLKVYSIDLKSMIVATGNISTRGMLPDGNYEYGVLVSNIPITERLFFEKIRKDSRLVNDNMHTQLMEWYDKQIKEPITKDEFSKIVIPTNDNFLISALPMTKDITLLINAYVKLNSGVMPSEDEEISSCVYHDLVNYGIELGLTRKQFLSMLKKQFFAHPFIKKIDEFISPEAYFGAIKEWIQNNCIDVPIPSRRELTDNVQVLYEWFEKLGDGKYVMDTPNYSQRLRKIKS